MGPHTREEHEATMAKLKAAVIGCGGRGNGHALGYSLSEHVELVACADTYLPVAKRMAHRYGFSAVYADYRQMLAEQKPDVVSMALWPDLHCEAVLGCVNAEQPPRLINAEKPMAPTFGECLAMHEACEKAGIMLTFSHQRRFGPTFGKARELLKDGAIGDLVHMDTYCGNLFDWGTHWFDMMLFYNDDEGADWVMGQVDCAEERLVFGALVESNGLSYSRFRNGVTGLLVTGPGTGGGCANRLRGTKGIIEVGHGGVRVLRESHDWEQADCSIEQIPGGDTSRYIIDSVECLLEGRESVLCSWKALQATEMIFATYESARRRQRVFLPLDLDDSPLLSMVEEEEIVIPDWPAFLTEAEEEEGFELLFNGQNLDGWQTAGSGTHGWTAQGGLIRCDGTGSACLWTADTFRDFVICLQYRLGCRSQSGLMLRAVDSDGAVQTPLTIQIRDDRREPVSNGSSGAIRGVLAPNDAAHRGSSTWNELRVTCQARTVTVELNGEHVLSCNAADNPQLEGWADEGFLALANAAGYAHFRDFRVKRLK